MVICTTSYPESGDGREAAGSFVSDFARELARRYPVTVLAPGHDASVEEEGDLHIERYAVPRQPLSLLRPLLPLDWPAIFHTLRQGQRGLDRIVMRGDVRHILALWALPSGHWARSVWRRHGIPYSVWALGSDIWSLARLPLVGLLLRRVLHDAHELYADGLLLAEEVRQLSGRHCEFLPSSRLLNDAPLKRRRQHPPYRLAFLGRWHPNKGVDLLLRALGLLEERDWRSIASVTIAGGGPLEDEVRQGAESLRRQGHPMRLSGFLDREGAKALLDETDYLIIPSRIESIPVLFSDALQCGCPVVTTPAGDLARLVPELEVGILTSGFSASDIAEAIRRALATPAAGYAEKLVLASGRFSVTSSVSRFCRRSLGGD